MLATPKKVLVALSGGVDSSVCVHLLKEQGYEVHCVVLCMSDAHDETVEAAKDAASSLNVPLEVVDMKAEFERDVISYFIEEYKNGRTPNPCIVCNPKVKFHALVETANRLGCELIATGHYARLQQDGEYTLLLRGESLKRDQSYMLYRLTQRELSRLMFPLAELEKPYVREIAASLGLSCATKPDSQENCFIEDNDYAGYIERRIGKMKTGNFISPEGTVCGKHKGILHYTVGQRKGLGIALGRPVFVKEINPKTNQIILANKGDDLYEDTIITKVTTINGIPFEAPFEAQVKIRSTAIPTQATIIPIDEVTARVVFETPQRAVAKGQSLVIYDGDVVLGGGFIS
ncbi:tRNA 2-thiouridine(34) synthase MnmA [Paludicola sp. MB14-C6]|uniref:tRNA 2-thiouridine(34) synthase MnmA n=1 Tax=Paludihabitans sp. MB14-C6 TaxID=3070656 RepID=UPI0027DBEA3D|nr:tRNA 2-thiouridine(34) synthase MnmA [Paludicola sp. MB14-C6]WMJ21896.1 tRNA 2-thiouridine(34) synthase MnmA [Paludicola sp. MB14-C6]